MITSSPLLDKNKRPTAAVVEEYDNTFGRLLRENIDSPGFRASAVMGRAEGQTHLLEKIHLHRFRPVRIGPLSLFRFVLSLAALMLFRSFAYAVLPGGFWYKRTSVDVVIRSFFDYRCLTSKKHLREEYFGPLTDEIGSKHSTLVIFKLIHRRDWILVLRAMANPNWTAIIQESVLNPLEVVWAIVCGCRYALIWRDLPDSIKFCGSDIRDFVVAACKKDFMSLSYFNYFFEEAVIRKLSRRHKFRVAILPFENHPWEKAWCWLRGRTDQNYKVIGFQHTGLSRKLRNYFCSAEEQKLPLFPDRILTVGNIMTNILTTESRFPAEIKTGAALRHTKLFTEGRICIQRSPGTPLGVVYAFSYDVSKYRAIIEVLIRVFGNTQIAVYLRIHPLYNEKEIIAALNTEVPSNFILAQSIPWPTIFPHVALTLYDDNSIGLESLASGVKSYMLDVGEPTYDCSRTFDFGFWKTNLTEAELVVFRNQMESGQVADDFDFQNIEDYLNNFYSPFVPMATMSAFLDGVL